jgi:helix-turn-helix protein
MASRATKAQPQPPELLDEREAAAYVRMSLAYLRADRTRGHVAGRTPGPAFLKIGRSVRYRRDDLDSWLAACRVDRAARRHDSDERTAA